MNIKFEKIPTSQVSAKAFQIGKTLKILETDNEALPIAENEKIVSLFFINKDQTYRFDFEVDNDPIAVSQLINELLYNMFGDKIEGIDPSEKDIIIRSIHIAAGQLAESENFDPSNKVIYHLLNGNTIYSDMRSINWENNIQHVDDLRGTTDRIRFLLRLLLSEKEYLPPASEDEPNPKSITVEEYVHGELMKFAEHNHIDTTYDMFDNDIIPERGLMIAKLVDMLTIYNEIIMVTYLMKLHDDLVSQNAQPEESVKENTPVTEAEVVSEGD